MTPRWHLKHALHGDRPWAVQTEALKRAAGRDRYGYWLEMGLGKTSLTLNEFINCDDVDICVVLAPNSFKTDWKVASAEWGVPFVNSGMWPRDPVPYKEECALYAANYEAARWSKRGEKGYAALEKLLNTRRCMLVIDESKAIGNPNSNTTYGVIELAKRAVMVRELNGTPLTQSPMDYYGQLRALGRLDGWSPVNFRNRFAVIGGFMGKQLMPEVKNADELAAILDECTFRALKSEWRKDLPLKTYSSICVELSDVQRVHYNTMMEEFYALIDDDEITAEMVLIQILKLQQISSGFILNNGKAHRIVEPKDNAKLQAILEIAGNDYGKTIVVHHYQDSGKLLIEALTKAKLKPAYIQGGMKSDAVFEQKRRFNEDPECRVLVGQERAVALGHTLLGKHGRDQCTRTCFFENSYSLYYRLQTEDRNHRGDQADACICYDFVASSVDAAVVEALIKKKEMATSMDTITSAVKKYVQK